MLTDERLAEYEYKAGYLNGLYWDTEEDGLDVKTLINHYRTLQQQNKQLKEALKELLFQAPENDVFDLYSASETESEEWKEAKEKANQALQSIQGGTSDARNNQPR